MTHAAPQLERPLHLDGARPKLQDRQHHFALDYLRFVAMADIVSMHGLGEHLLGGIGLPMLLLISTGLQASRVPPPPPADVARRRARRLMIPWLFWSLLYAVWLAGLSRVRGESPLAWFDPWMLLYGPVIHLWFVPFLFLSTPVVAVFARAAHRHASTRAALAASCIGIGVLVCCATLRCTVALPQPTGQWVFGLASLPFGVALGVAIADRQRRRVMLPALGVLGLMIALCGIERIALPFGCERWMLRRFGFALTTVALATCLRGGDHALRRLLVITTFGVYLVHPLVWMILQQHGLVGVPDWTDFVVVYAASTGIILGLRAVGLKRVI